MKQIEMHVYSHGGARKGAGRKRVHSKGVAHRKRETVKRRNPLHINFKYRTYIRNKLCLRILKRAIMNSRGQGLQVIHFSLQHNHVHLIVESENNAVLTKGMRSLLVTFAKGLKQGRVQVERYHLHVLKSLRETKNAVRYVLFNEQKHRNLKQAYVDRYSSLQFWEDLGLLAKTMKISIVVREREKTFLDKGKTWLINQVMQLT